MTTRRLLSFVAVLALCVVVFLATRTLSDVPDNAKAIRSNCETVNQIVALVNADKAKLLAVFDAATPPDRPIDPKVAVLYEQYRKPIPLTDCRSLGGS